MSVTKTYSLTIKFSKGDAGYKGSRRIKDEFEDYTEPVLDETDLAYKELRRVVLAKLNAVVPISRGIDSANIVGTITES